MGFDTGIVYEVRVINHKFLQIVHLVHLVPTEPHTTRLTPTDHEVHVEKEPQDRKNIASPEAKPLLLMICSEFRFSRDPVIHQEFPYQRTREERRLTVQPVLVRGQCHPFARKRSERNKTEQQHHIDHKARGFFARLQ